MRQDFKKQNTTLIDLSGKIPPQAVDIEEIVLGTLLIEPNSIDEVESILKPETFYKEAHRLIYEAIYSLKKDNINIDPYTVTNRLKKQGKIEEAGGIIFVNRLTQAVASSVNLVYHSLILQQEFIKRLSIQLSSKITDLSFKSDSDLEDIIKAIDELQINIDTEIQNATGNYIEDSIIRLSDNLKYEPHFFAIKEDDKLKGLFSKNNLSLILGKAKSRKTFACTLFAAQIVGGLNNKIFWSNKSHVVYFDTEQSKFHGQKIIKRVASILQVDSHPENFQLYCIKRYDTSQRKKIIETIIKRDRPELVFIDGIRDLMLDFNDLRETTQLVNWLMMLIDKYNCHLSLILHLNKSDQNARGHLGTELINKCECALIVEKDPDYNDYSIIKPSETRGESFKPLQFQIIAGVPDIIGNYEISEPKRKNENPF